MKLVFLCIITLVMIITPTSAQLTVAPGTPPIGVSAGETFTYVAHTLDNVEINTDSTTTHHAMWEGTNTISAGDDFELIVKSDTVLYNNVTQTYLIQIEMNGPHGVINGYQDITLWGFISRIDWENLTKIIETPKSNETAGFTYSYQIMDKKDTFGYKISSVYSQTNEIFIVNNQTTTGASFYNEFKGEAIYNREKGNLLYEDFQQHIIISGIPREQNIDVHYIYYLRGYTTLGGGPLTFNPLLVTGFACIALITIKRSRFR